MATKEQVLTLRAKHPDMSSSEMAALLNCNPSYVRATIARAKGYRPPALRTTVISAEERAEREQDHRDLDMLADLDEGHSESQVADHWGVTRNYVHNLRRNAKEAA